MPKDEWPKLAKGFHRLRSQFPTRLVNQGEYRIELLIALYHRQFISCPGSNAPSIRLSIQGGLSDSPYWIERRPGVIAPVLTWSSDKRETPSGV
jgi:lipopolysaccharide transport system ATP-binding protein